MKQTYILRDEYTNEQYIITAENKEEALEKALKKLGYKLTLKSEGNE
jgi:hypothetical protein